MHRAIYSSIGDRVSRTAELTLGMSGIVVGVLLVVFLRIGKFIGLPFLIFAQLSTLPTFLFFAFLFVGTFGAVLLRKKPFTGAMLLFISGMASVTTSLYFLPFGQFALAQITLSALPLILAGFLGILRFWFQGSHPTNRKEGIDSEEDAVQSIGIETVMGISGGVFSLLIVFLIFSLEFISRFESEEIIATSVLATAAFYLSFAGIIGSLNASRSPKTAGTLLSVSGFGTFLIFAVFSLGEFFIGQSITFGEFLFIILIGPLLLIVSGIIAFFRGPRTEA